MSHLIAYHGEQSTKDEILSQLATHRRADELVKGQYWEGGKGCAVGCTVYSGKHIEYEHRFGIPVMLARLEDCIFEGLPNDEAGGWPERFMASIQPGQDLSRVGWQFLHWILTDQNINPGISHDFVRDAVKQCADVTLLFAKGNKVDASAAESAAESAARSAGSAAESAESAAYEEMARKLIDLIEAAP